MMSEVGKIWNDPDISLHEETNTDFTIRPASLNEKLPIMNVQSMAKLLSDLHAKSQQSINNTDANPIDWTEWIAFLERSYDLGFVCRDANNRMDDGTSTSLFIAMLSENRKQVQILSLRQIRQVIHYIVRSERWADLGSERGSGTLYRFVNDGLAESFACRLSGGS